MENQVSALYLSHLCFLELTLLMVSHFSVTETDPGDELASGKSNPLGDSSKQRFCALGKEPHHAGFSFRVTHSSK